MAASVLSFHRTGKRERNVVRRILRQAVLEIALVFLEGDVRWVLRQTTLGCLHSQFGLIWKMNTDMGQQFRNAIIGTRSTLLLERVDVLVDKESDLGGEGNLIGARRKEESHIVHFLFIPMLGDQVERLRANREKRISLEILVFALGPVVTHSL